MSSICGHNASSTAVSNGATVQDEPSHLPLASSAMRSQRFESDESEASAQPPSQAHFKRGLFGSDGAGRPIFCLESGGIGSRAPPGWAQLPARPREGMCGRVSCVCASPVLNRVEMDGNPLAVAEAIACQDMHAFLPRKI
jgi:hypothetical protein